MFSKTRIRMFKNTFSIKPSKSMGIGCKVSRNPIQNYTDVMLMQLIDKIHEIIRRSVTGGRCIVSGHLITPGSIKRMLSNSHQFNMSIFHFCQVFHNAVCKLTIIVESLLFRTWMTHPGTNMTLINCHWLFIIILQITFLHPRGICPAELCQIRCS